MGRRENELCPTCQEVDFIEHFFVRCKDVQPLWQEVDKIINSWIGKKILLDEPSILLGPSDPEIEKDHKKNINHLILIAKMCISKFKYGKGYNIIQILHKECALRGVDVNSLNKC